MLIITGTQRSGTSLTAKFFSLCGFDIGSDFWHPDVNGGLENYQICWFFRNYLGDSSFPFSDLPFPNPPPKSNITDISCKAAKFSYMLMIPCTIYIWYKYRSNTDSFLILKRNPQHIIRSKQRTKRFSTDSWLLNQSPRQVKENFSLSLNIIQSLGFNHVVLQFPKFLHDFNYFSDCAEKLGVSIRGHESIWNKLIDYNKVHFS